MGVEIERKYLVRKELWAKAKPEKSISITQAYLSRDLEKTIRLRIADDKGFITVKGPTTGISRAEFEYEMPLDGVKELMEAFPSSPIVKIRHHVTYKNKLWEVDEFLGENEGLIVAEIELKAEDEIIDLPEWIDKEISKDKRYANSNLAGKPFKTWM
ncbi:MAG: CYTH domain-containing protein [Bacteroidota bacterium]|nr:CYTH domain-containing protein [Bacteroidota bacterium]